MYDESLKITGDAREKNTLKIIDLRDWLKKKGLNWKINIMKTNEKCTCEIEED